jgi:hypothetical protein
MGLQENLEAVLNGLSAGLTGTSQPGPGQPVRAAVIPSVNALTLTEVLSGDVDLTWVAKDVMYSTSDLEPDFASPALNAATLAGKPITGATGIIPVAGVPGLLGQLQGQIPLSSGASVPVQAFVTWQVLDDQGNPLDPALYLAPMGLSSASVSVIFAPATAELTDTGGLPAPARRSLRATVRLTAGTVGAGPRTLPDIPVFVPAVPIPTVLAMFLHVNFQARSGDDEGAVLIVVPSNSPFRSLQQLQPALNTLQSTVGNLTSFASFAAFLLGLNELVSTIGAQPYVQFRAADRIANLDDITLIQRSWYENDTEAEDELSSLILIGREKRGARCSNDTNQDPGEGQFTVRTGGSLFVLVRNLHSVSPAAEGGTLVIDRAPPGGWREPDQFGDELSSFEFV